MTRKRLANESEHGKRSTQYGSRRCLPAALMAFFVILSVDAVTAYAQKPPSRYALLIAVTRYQHQAMDENKLVYPEIDAKAIGEFLSDHGYTVEYLLGKAATKSAIEAKLKQMNTKGDTDGAVLLGLWGHGVEFEGKRETMFCPYDASVRPQLDGDQSQLYGKDGDPLLEPDPSTLVGTRQLLFGLKLSGGGSRILLADCCRNSPNKARGRAFGSEVSVASLPTNTAAIFACQATEQAFEDDAWGHGAMTRGLLDLLPGVAEKEFDDIGSFAFPLKRKVASLVSARNKGRAEQTVTPIIKGTPELKLRKDRYAEFRDGFGTQYKCAATTALRPGEVGKLIFCVEPAKPWQVYPYFGKSEVTTDLNFVLVTDHDGLHVGPPVRNKTVKVDGASVFYPGNVEWNVEVRAPDDAETGEYSISGYFACAFVNLQGSAAPPQVRRFTANLAVTDQSIYELKEMVLEDVEYDAFRRALDTKKSE